MEFGDRGLHFLAVVPTNAFRPFQEGATVP